VPAAKVLRAVASLGFVSLAGVLPAPMHGEGSPTVGSACGPVEKAPFRSVALVDLRTAKRVSRQRLAPDPALVRYLSQAYVKSPELVDTILRTANAEADRARLPRMLVYAVIATESSFDPEAVSVTGARGLMQVQPEAHPEKVALVSEPGGLLHPVANIRVGVQVLEQYVTATSGDLDDALRRYSGASRGYTQKVERHWVEFSRICARCAAF